MRPKIDIQSQDATSYLDKKLSPHSQTQTGYGAIDWRHILFFVGTPIAIAIYETMSDRFWLDYLGVGTSTLFHLGHAVIPWWITAVSTKLVMEVLRIWKPPLLLILVLGAVIANFLSAPFAYWMTNLFTNAPLNNASESQFSGIFLEDVLSWAHAGVIWVAASLLFDRFLGLHIFRYEPQSNSETNIATYTENTTLTKTPSLTDSPPAPPHPRFLQRLEKEIQPMDITVLKAEEHYVHIFTDLTEELVLYRFSDAISEMDARLGCQVHRSYWVNFQAIDRIESQIKRVTIYLRDGKTIPVSTRYQEIVRQRANKEGISVNKSA